MPKKDHTLPQNDTSWSTCDAFEPVVIEHFDALYHAAIRLTRDRYDAQDLVQETYLRAYRFAGHFEPGTNMRAWLLTILRNLHTNAYRKTARRPRQVHMATIEPFYEDPSADIEWMGHGSLEERLPHLVQDEVKQALDALLEEYRQVVLMADLENYSYKEIAARVGCPAGTVMSRLFRGRRLLRQRLEAFATRMGYIKRLPDHRLSPCEEHESVLSC